MTVEEAVIARLRSIAAVTALVGTRIYQLKLPQNVTMPAIRVQHVDELDAYHLRGSGKPIRSRVQVDVYGSESSGSTDPLAAVNALAKAVNGNGLGSQASGLSGWIGTLGSPPFTIVGIFRVDDTQDYEADVLRLIRVRQDYFVWWKE